MIQDDDFVNYVQESVTAELPFDTVGSIYKKPPISKVIMQGKLFQRCTHLLYCSVLSLGGNVNTRRMSKPGMRSTFHIKNQWNIVVIGNYYVNYQNLMLLTSSDTRLIISKLAKLNSFILHGY